MKKLSGIDQYIVSLSESEYKWLCKLNALVSDNPIWGNEWDREYPGSDLSRPFRAICMWVHLHLKLRDVKEAMKSIDNLFESWADRAEDEIP